MFKYTLNQKEFTFYSKKNARQRRIIIRPLNQDSFQVSMPKHTTKKMLLEVIKENEKSLIGLKPQLDIIDTMIQSKEVKIFGNVYQLQFGNKMAINHEEKILYINVTRLEHSLIEKALKNALKEILLEEVKQLEVAYQKDFDLSHVQYRFQYMKSKFGSCQPLKKHISLNIELIHYPKVYLEYIYVHELCHLKVPNHSLAFYELMENYIPNHKDLKKSLNHLRKALYKPQALS